MDPQVPRPSTPPAAPRDAERARDAGVERGALRVQAAAVAAQQAALDEREGALERRAEEVAARETRLEVLEKALQGQRVRQSGDGILARHQLKDAWDALRRARQRWHKRRRDERTALRLRAHQIEASAAQLDQARKQLRAEQESWRAAREALEVEIDGLNQRAVNQRQVLARLEGERRRLEEAGARQGVEGAAAAGAAAPAASAGHVGNVPHENVPHEHAAAIAELESLAGALADQRLVLIEAWERLARLHADWHGARQELTVELEALGAQLLEQDLHLQTREQVCGQTEAALCQRHEHWLRNNRRVVAWQARLRADEENWEREKGRVLAECRHEQAVAERQTAALADLRQRWLGRRKHEVQQLRSERETLESFRKEFAKLRQELTTRAWQLEQDQRILIEKTLAVEQLRNETTTSAGDPQEAEHRLDLLRRRWIMHNAAAIRATRRQRSALQRELKTLETRYEALQNRSLTLEAAETALADKQTGWEHREIGIAGRQARLEFELERAKSQQRLAERECATLREEIERIARALLDEPDPPQQPQQALAA